MAQENNLVVIGNQTGVPGDIKMNELKAVFRGERQRWGDGTKVVIARIKTTTPLGNAISEKIYSMNGDEAWILAGILFAENLIPTCLILKSKLKPCFTKPGAIAISTGSPLLWIQKPFCVGKEILNEMRNNQFSFSLCE
jgi:hypothetical protein